MDRQVPGDLAGSQGEVRLRSGTVRGRTTAVEDQRRQHGAVRRQAYRRREGADDEVPPVVLDERLPEPSRFRRSRRNLRARQGKRRVRGSHRRRSEDHTSDLQSLMRISYAVFFLKKKTTSTPTIWIIAHT